MFTRRVPEVASKQRERLALPRISGWAVSSSLGK